MVGSLAGNFVLQKLALPGGNASHGKHRVSASTAVETRMRGYLEIQIKRASYWLTKNGARSFAALGAIPTDVAAIQ
jgi:hypothetical protein